MKAKKSNSKSNENDAGQMIKRIFLVAEIINQSDFYQQKRVNTVQSNCGKTHKP